MTYHSRGQGLLNNNLYQYDSTGHLTGRTKATTILNEYVYTCVFGLHRPTVRNDLIQKRKKEKKLGGKIWFSAGPSDSNEDARERPLHSMEKARPGYVSHEKAPRRPQRFYSWAYSRWALALSAHVVG